MKHQAEAEIVDPVASEEFPNAPGDAQFVSANSRFVAASSSMRRLSSVICRVSSSDAPVLIQGETGAGKEVVARQLHLTSRRAAGPFLKVNCAALPSELIESELFGYERGAFTGANQNKPGMFELADSGIILLDEIGDMELRLQAKLLQVLQDQQFYRLGGKEAIHVNVRVIAATHRDLESAVANGTFRADLFYRLNVIDLHVPPLRERREDIVPLANLMLERHGVSGMPVAVPPVLRQALLEYNWPGNVRELENIVRKLLILGNAEAIALELHTRQKNNAGFSPAQVHHDDQAPLLDEISKAGGDAEAAAIRAALETARWNRKAAARLLGAGYKALLYRMKKLGITDVDAPVIPFNSIPRHAARRRGAGV